MAGKSNRAMIFLLKEVYAAFDPGNRNQVPVSDLPNVLKCVGLGPDDIQFSEVEELRQAIDPRGTGFMSFEDVKRVVGRELTPDPTPFAPIPFEGLDMSVASASGEAGAPSGEGSRNPSATRARPRSRSLVRSPSRASPERQRPGLGDSAGGHSSPGSPSAGGLTSDDAWKQFKKFDLERRGIMSEGDLVQVNAKYCNSFLTEGECAFIVETLRSSKYRGGLTFEDFKLACAMPSQQ